MTDKISQPEICDILRKMRGEDDKILKMFTEAGLDFDQLQECYGNLMKSSVSNIIPLWDFS